jgi:hypothetical protein
MAVEAVERQFVSASPALQAQDRGLGRPLGASIDMGIHFFNTESEIDASIDALARFEIWRSRVADYEGIPTCVRRSPPRRREGCGGEDRVPVA